MLRGERRGSQPEVFCKKGFLKETLAQVFSCEFCEIFNNTLFIEYFWWLLLLQDNFKQPCETVLGNKFSYLKEPSLSCESLLHDVCFGARELRLKSWDSVSKFRRKVFSYLFMMSTLWKNKEGDLQSVEEDLLLAAEIGKSLLERNRELELLLKTTQDYAEEQSSQVEFYVQQINVLRETSEAENQSYEQLEGKYQQLQDKYEQQKADNKLLEGKNLRLWERISSLEKTNSELCAEANTLQERLDEQDEILSKQNNQINMSLRVEEQVKRKNIAEFEKYGIKDEIHEKFGEMQMTLQNHENENKTLKELIADIKGQLNIEKWQKEEMVSQLDDVINENESLHQKICNLNQEIHEWENFAQKEENYRKLAQAFTIKHNIESDFDDHLLQPENYSPRTQKLIKARSCEFLNKPLSEGNPKIIKSSNLVKEILSCQNSSSFLSELDSEYADLIQRYEALLEKCKQEGKFNENPIRTRKVQRAIQTLSFDFSTLTSTLGSPTKLNKKDFTDSATKTDQVTEHDVLVTAVKSNACPCSCQTRQVLSSDSDYRKMFEEIFAKIKESKDF